jgi:hypothetical protein
MLKREKRLRQIKGTSEIRVILYAKEPSFHTSAFAVSSIRVLAKLGLRYRETRPVSQESGPSRPVCVWQIERERW